MFKIDRFSIIAYMAFGNKQRDLYFFLSIIMNKVGLAQSSLVITKSNLQQAIEFIVQL